jgi:hypothetical protein
MNRIEEAFPLNGDLNKHPFDRYQRTAWLLMTTPAENVQPQPSEVLPAVPEFLHQAEKLAVSSTALLRNAPVALSVSILASMPGVKFKGGVSRGNIQEPRGLP